MSNHNQPNPTEEELKAYADQLFTKDPQAELRIELGKLLMIHIDDLTPEQKKRYDELLILVK